MNILNIPGFTAEAALYRMGLSYWNSGDISPAGDFLTPQACDPVCLDNCGDPSDCNDLPPALRARCRAAVARCDRGCCPPSCGPCTPGPCNPDCSRQPSTRTCRNTNTGSTFTEPC